MRNLVILALIVLSFNACSVTSHYKVNSDLQFEYLEENQRVTYTFFEEKKQTQSLNNKQSNDTLTASFADEFKEEKNNFDPLEGYNRAMTSFNDFLYLNILNPVAKGYATILPEEARIGVSNFIHNITFPIRFINNILQLKFENASIELGRFAVNSTFGILGLMDPASNELNWEKKPEDFGQTLGYYGVGEGFHIVLPVYGPSNLRDLVGLVGDSYVSPLSDTGSLEYKIPDRIEKTFAIKAFDTVNDTSLNLGKYENLKKDAIDLYPFLKDVYTQNREKQIKE